MTEPKFNIPDDPCEDCHGTGTYEKTLVNEGIEQDAPVYCDCEAGEKLMKSQE